MAAKQSPQDLGKRGEAIASRYLADQGWIELEHNWRPHAQGLRLVRPWCLWRLKPAAPPATAGPLRQSPTPSYTNCACWWPPGLESIPAPGPHLGWM